MIDSSKTHDLFVGVEVVKNSVRKFSRLNICTVTQVKEIFIRLISCIIRSNTTGNT